MSYKHAINDPVFGFINIPNNFIYLLIQHPIVQRLNRIKQLGMASFVYPGAQHTRFNHSIGAMHLMQEAITSLQSKGNQITEDEANGVLACILLHDIGHGPFSHVLEHTIIKDIHHEEISLILMKELNKYFDGALNTCIAIFKDDYPKKFLHQLVSSQLDIDRLDYLRRDCFFTGVTEGNIGSERLIKIMDVRNNNLVIEIKGIYSIENFLLSRRLMYWQVYHHKTAVSAECLLINVLKRAKYLISNGYELFAIPSLCYFLEKEISKNNFTGESLNHFLNLDDSDIITTLKIWCNHKDFVLSTLSKCFIDRKLFKVTVSDHAPDNIHIESLIKDYCKTFDITKNEALYFIGQRTIVTNTYTQTGDSINLLDEQNQLKNISDVSDILNIQLLSRESEKFYFTYLDLPHLI